MSNFIAKLLKFTFLMYVFLLKQGIHAHILNQLPKGQLQTVTWMSPENFMIFVVLIIISVHGVRKFYKYQSLRFSVIHHEIVGKLMPRCRCPASARCLEQQLIKLLSLLANFTKYLKEECVWSVVSKINRIIHVCCNNKPDSDP